jgi:hypothetical protein
MTATESASQQALQHSRVMLAGRLYRDYSVVLIQAGRANGLDFGPALLAASAPLFSGAPMYCDHAADGANRSVRDLVGLVTAARYNPQTQCIEGTCRLFSHAQWIQQLIDAAGAANPSAGAAALYPHVGLSADLWLFHNNGVVHQIERVVSVDIVANPAAGGRFVAAFPEDPPTPNERKENVPMQQQSVDSEHAPASGTVTRSWRVSRVACDAAHSAACAALVMRASNWVRVSDSPRRCAPSASVHAPPTWLSAASWP